jgi:hypothetical protein
MHELRKHRNVCTVRHLQCACLLILFFTVLQVQHGVQHDARAKKAPPCARVPCTQAMQYLWRTLSLAGQLLLFVTVTYRFLFNTYRTRYYMSKVRTVPVSEDIGSWILEVKEDLKFSSNANPEPGCLPQRGSVGSWSDFLVKKLNFYMKNTVSYRYQKVRYVCNIGRS